MFWLWGCVVTSLLIGMNATTTWRGLAGFALAGFTVGGIMMFALDVPGLP